MQEMAQVFGEGDSTTRLQKYEANPKSKKDE
jgi:hypothetical protein